MQRTAYIFAISYSLFSLIFTKVEGKECIWSGIDYALDPPERRVLRAVFSSIQAAQQMHTFFEDVSKD